MKKIISVLTATLVAQVFPPANYVPEVQANPVIEIAQNSTNSNLIQKGLALLKKKKIFRSS